MNIPNLLHISAFLQNNPDGAVRTVIYQADKDLTEKHSENSNVVLWQIPQNHSLPAHKHPNGQDTWLVVSGRGELIDDAGSCRLVQAGDVVVIGSDQKHGIYNTDEKDLVLLSVVRVNAGFIPLDK